MHLLSITLVTIVQYFLSFITQVNWNTCRFWNRNSSIFCHIYATEASLAWYQIPGPHFSVPFLLTRSSCLENNLFTIWGKPVASQQKKKFSTILENPSEMVANLTARLSCLGVNWATVIVTQLHGNPFVFRSCSVIIIYHMENFH